MTKNTVAVAQPILNWVLDNVQLDQLPTQISDYLIKWSNGEKEPTFSQIEKVSRATGIPLGYFFLQIPPREELPLLEYRTVNSQNFDHPSRELIDTMHDMDQVQEWTRNHLKTEGADPLSFVSALTGNTSPMQAAQKIRELLGLVKDWYKSCSNNADSFRHLRTLISNLGVLVMMSGIVGNNTHRPLSISEFRAFAVVDDYAPLIFINSNDSDNGRLFSLLHEFVHICLGEDDLFNDRASTASGVKRVEVFCNAVAAEVLVPVDLFTEAWKQTCQEYDIKQALEILAKEFRCGITVIARRACDSGYITAKEYQEIAQLAVKLYADKRKKDKEEGKSGGDYYRTAASRIDQRFFSMLSTSVATGRTLYSDAFRLTNTNRSTFFKLAETRLGGGFF